MGGPQAFKEDQKPAIGMVDDVTVKALIKDMPLAVWQQVMTRYAEYKNGLDSQSKNMREYCRDQITESIAKWIRENYRFVQGAKLEQFAQYTNMFAEAARMYETAHKEVSMRIILLPEWPAGMFLRTTVERYAAEALGPNPIIGDKPKQVLGSGLSKELGPKLVAELYPELEKMRSTAVAEDRIKSQEWKLTKITMPKTTAGVNDAGTYRVNFEQRDGTRKTLNLSFVYDARGMKGIIDVKPTKSFYERVDRIAAEIQKRAAAKGIELTEDRAEKLAEAILKDIIAREKRVGG